MIQVIRAYLEYRVKSELGIPKAREYFYGGNDYDDYWEIMARFGQWITYKDIIANPDIIWAIPQFIRRTKPSKEIIEQLVSNYPQMNVWDINSIQADSESSDFESSDSESLEPYLFELVNQYGEEYKKRKDDSFEDCMKYQPELIDLHPDLAWQHIVDMPNYHWAWNYISETRNFNKPEKEYKYLTNLNKKLEILGKIPTYIKMEMMEDKTVLSYYNLFHTIA
jgi:hypothetical protein